MAIQLVKKGSGHTERFDPVKFERSIAGALNHVGAGDRAKAKEIAELATAHLAGSPKETVTAQDLERAVIHVMREHKLVKAAESYALASLDMRDIPVEQVIKRSGGLERFQPKKLFKSIKKSLERAGTKEAGALAEKLTGESMARLATSGRHTPLPAAMIRTVTAALLTERNLKGARKFYLLHKYL